jgi:hypothetical protein
MGDDIYKKIADFNERLQVLDRKFSLYFNGYEKVPPIKEFEQFKREVALFIRTKGNIMSVCGRFFVNSFQQRFVSYRTKWEKGLRDIEEGRAKPGYNFWVH